MLEVALKTSILSMIIASFKDMIDTAMCVASRVFPFANKTLYVAGLAKNIFKPSDILTTSSLTRGLASLRSPALFLPPFTTFSKTSFFSMIVPGFLTLHSKEVLVFALDIGHPDMPQTKMQSSDNSFLETLLKSMSFAISSTVLNLFSK